MAPPGTKIVAHTKPNKRDSFGYHGQDGYYVGPALEHYRCVQCYIPITRSVIIADTVQFFPCKIKFPSISINDHLLHAVEDIISILHDKKFQISSPALTFFNETKLCIQLVADILHTITKKPELPPPSPFLHQVRETIHQMTKNNSTNKIPITPTLNVKKHITSVPRMKQPEPNQSTGHLTSNTKQHNTNIAQVPKVLKQRRIAKPIIHPRARLFTRFKGPMLDTLRLQCLRQQLAYHIYNKDGKKETLKSLLQNPVTHDVWAKSSSNEYGRLLKGNKYGVTGTNTMTPCALTDIPKNKCVTYGTVVCDHRPNKTEEFRSRLVVGGDKLPYAHDAAAPAANLLETKLILNSTISQRQSKFFCIDIKDFF